MFAQSRLSSYVLHKMTNKERYDHFTAELFALLYVNHPVEQDFEIPSSAEHAEVDRSALRFLNENGYLRFEQTMGGGYHDVRFTDMGLALLEMPSSSDTQVTAGQQIVAAVKDGSLGVAASIVAHILIQGVSS